jgi:hypothetical protein
MAANSSFEEKVAINQNRPATPMFYGDMNTSSVGATPDVPDIQTTQGLSSRSAVKVATPDLILFNESAIPVDVMTDLLFEEIGGQEIISIARNDIVNGQEVSYSLIGNLNGLERRYNSKNIFSLPDTIEKYFSNFSIRFETHVPENGTGPGGQRVYIVQESTSTSVRGDLIIDVINMETNERIDVEVLKSGRAFSDTIYTEES